MELLIRNAFLLAAFVVSLFITPACLAADEQEATRFLLTARPSSIKLIRLGEDAERGLSPAYFEAEVADVRVIHGDVERFPRKFKAQIRATDSYAFMKHDRVFIVVEKDLDGTIRVVHWSEVVSMACAPREVISTGVSDQFFESPWAAGSVCMFVRGQK